MHEESTREESTREESTCEGSRVAQPLVLDPLASTVAAARSYVRQMLRQVGAEELEESAELGVSELVTNALLHARTAFSVQVCVMDSGRVRIGVSDASAASLRLRRMGQEVTTGRGLRLLESISSDWGVDPLPTEQGSGKTVWFEPKEVMTSAGFVADDWAEQVQGLL
ncbi:ATP-binding protein [Kineococcus arenarius]|uniref:ATP-binding protein n=1 Tax=Kineococcus sp. SYSU DK007 TaxID=3383128 RepID=UPI003D7E2655